MKGHNILILLVSIILAVLILHLGGTFLHLYWRFDFYDRVVHLLSSFWVTLVIFTLFIRGGVLFTQKRNILITGICATLIIGIAWEFFEYFIGQTSVADKEFLRDTAGDIILDSIGGLVGSLYTIKLLNLWNNKKPL